MTLASKRQSQNQSWSHLAAKPEFLTTTLNHHLVFKSPTAASPICIVQFELPFLFFYVIDCLELDIFTWVSNHTIPKIMALGPTVNSVPLLYTLLNDNHISLVGSSSEPYRLLICPRCASHQAACGLGVHGPCSRLYLVLIRDKPMYVWVGLSPGVKRSPGDSMFPSSSPRTISWCSLHPFDPQADTWASS